MSAPRHDDGDGGSEDYRSEEEMSQRRCALANARAVDVGTDGGAPCS